MKNVAWRIAPVLAVADLQFLRGLAQRARPIDFPQQPIATLTQKPAFLLIPQPDLDVQLHEWICISRHIDSHELI